jgi:hypothetical protein
MVRDTGIEPFFELLLELCCPYLRRGADPHPLYAGQSKQRRRTRRAETDVTACDAAWRLR